MVGIRTQACRRCQGPMPPYAGAGRRRTYCSERCSVAEHNEQRRRTDRHGVSVTALEGALLRMRARLDRAHAHARELEAAAKRSWAIPLNAGDAPRLLRCAVEFRRMRRALRSITKPAMERRRPETSAR